MHPPTHVVAITQRSHFALRVAFLFCGFGLSLTQSAGADAATVAGSVVRAAPTSAELMRTGYLALVRDSIVPADPRVVGAAALAAIASLDLASARTLPAAFGSDAGADAAWLAEGVTNLPSVWPILDSMARAADTAHVGLGSPQKGKGMRALMTGHPLAAPGFNLYPLADGRLVVFDVIKGASADMSGLREGDVVVRINGARALRVDGFLLNSMPAGEELKLEIERANHPETILLRLIKADVASVESRLLDDGIGYVFVRWFARSDDPEFNTAALVRRAFTSFAAQGSRRLILDLRSALGGAGEVSMASALCDSEIIYAIRQPLTAPPRSVKRVGECCWRDCQIVILVNEFTVSAGEALALSLRELTHAKIVGQTTGGGLTEMSFVPLADGYSMSIPTGVVLGPVSGEVPAGFAVKPDVVVPNANIGELLGGRDGQLSTARAMLAGGLLPRG